MILSRFIHFPCSQLLFSYMILNFRSGHLPKVSLCNFHCISLASVLATFPVHHTFLNLTILIILADLYKSRSFSLYTILNCSLTLIFLKSNIFLHTKFSDMRNLCSSLKILDHIYLFIFFYLVGWDLTPIRSLCRSPRFV
jgi:hypothetical protein